MRRYVGLHKQCACIHGRSHTQHVAWSLLRNWRLQMSHGFGMWPVETIWFVGPPGLSNMYADAIFWRIFTLSKQLLTTVHGAALQLFVERNCIVSTSGTYYLDLLLPDSTVILVNLIIVTVRNSDEFMKWGRPSIQTLIWASETAQISNHLCQFISLYTQT